MAGQPAKLCWLAGYVYHVVRERQRKLLIFCAFPLTLLNTFAFLSDLGCQYLTIRVDWPICLYAYNQEGNSAQSSRRQVEMVKQ